MSKAKEFIKEKKRSLLVLVVIVCAGLILIAYLAETHEPTKWNYNTTGGIVEHICIRTITTQEETTTYYTFRLHNENITELDYLPKEAVIGSELHVTTRTDQHGNTEVHEVIVINHQWPDENRSIIIKEVEQDNELFGLEPISWMLIAAIIAIPLLMSSRR